MASNCANRRTLLPAVQIRRNLTTKNADLHGCKPETAALTAVRHCIAPTPRQGSASAGRMKQQPALDSTTGRCFCHLADASFGSEKRASADFVEFAPPFKRAYRGARPRHIPAFSAPGRRPHRSTSQSKWAGQRLRHRPARVGGVNERARSELCRTAHRPLPSKFRQAPGQGTQAARTTDSNAGLYFS